MTTGWVAANWMQDHILPWVLIVAVVLDGVCFVAIVYLLITEAVKGVRGRK